MSGDGANTDRNTAGLRPPFPKGVSGNPKGRPKGVLSFAKKLRIATKQGADLVKWALAIASDAGNRDQMRAIEFIADRMLGKAPQTIEMTGPGGSPLQAAMDRPLQGLTVDELLKLELLARRAIADADKSIGGPGVDAQAPGALAADPVVPAGPDGATAEVPGADKP